MAWLATVVTVPNSKLVSHFLLVSFFITTIRARTVEEQQHPTQSHEQVRPTLLSPRTITHREFSVERTDTYAG